MNKQPKKDRLQSLGELAFGSRLKRLSEKLMKDCSNLYRDLDTDFEARWFSTLSILSDGRPRAIAELADAIGLSHAAIIQISKEMTNAGLLRSQQDKNDKRCRILTLSPKGYKIREEMHPIWHEIKAATSELVSEAGPEWLHGLEKLENALKKECMYDRLRKRLVTGRIADVSIESYRPAYKKHFAALNYAWIDQYFKIEAEDKKLLDDPNGQIIRRGGSILFAKVKKQVVGTCALIKHSSTSFELAKMAVDPTYQGYGIGRKLGQAIITQASDSGCQILFLLTHDNLKPAISLYHQLGFGPPKNKYDMCGKYQRCTIAMELSLTNSKKISKKSVSRRRVK